VLLELPAGMTARALAPTDVRSKPRGRTRHRYRPSTTVRLCSCMNPSKYQRPSPPLPDDPLRFQPQKDWFPGHAPVVAPADGSGR